MLTKSVLDFIGPGAAKGYHASVSVDIYKHASGMEMLARKGDDSGGTRTRGTRGTRDTRGSAGSAGMCLAWRGRARTGVVQKVAQRQLLDFLLLGRCTSRVGQRQQLIRGVRVPRSSRAAAGRGRRACSPMIAGFRSRGGALRCSTKARSDN